MISKRLRGYAELTMISKQKIHERRETPKLEFNGRYETKTIFITMIYNIEKKNESD